MSERRLIFPCGAYFPLSDDDAQWLESAHRAKDGAYRIGVYPSSRPHLDEDGEVLARVKERRDIDYDGKRAPCEFFCPVKTRRKEERGYDADGQRGKFISCHARIYSQEHIDEGEELWYDITPPLMGAVEELGELAHAHLKAEQGIRGTAEQHEAAGKDAVADVVIYLADYCSCRGWDMEQIVMETWDRVKQRDWKRDKVSGGSGELSHMQSEAALSADQPHTAFEVEP